MHHLTRIAPTPSGYLHIGNLYSFVLTALIARREGAEILLRIDDLDAQRSRRDYIDDIFRTLEFAGIIWQKGPSGPDDFYKSWSQHTRMEQYDAAMEKLADDTILYACSCSRKDLASHGSGGYTRICREKRIPLATEQCAWRIITSDAPIPVRDLFAGEEFHPLPSQMLDFIVRRKDGVPSYQLASLVDDCYYGVDLIVRGRDLFPSTIAQLYLAKASGAASFGKVSFFHHKTLTQCGEKISKTQHAPSVRTLCPTREALYLTLSSMMGLERQAASFDELYEIAGEQSHFPALD